GEPLEAAIPGELQGGDQLANPSPVGVFGLEYTKFGAGLERVPMLEALKVSLNPVAVLRDYEARFGITGHLRLKWCEVYAIWLLWVSSYKCVGATGEAAVTAVGGIGDLVVGGYLLASLWLSILICLPRLIYGSIEGVQRGWVGVLLVVLILDSYMEYVRMERHQRSRLRVRPQWGRRQKSRLCIRPRVERRRGAFRPHLLIVQCDLPWAERLGEGAERQSGRIVTV
ncbi:hypothetical protein F443_22581, partial [Phytophthora nicotianae P1569]